MNENSDGHRLGLPVQSQPDGVVYLVAPGALAAIDGGLDVVELMEECWRRRWLIAAITVAFVLCGIAYALLAPRWYRAEVVMVPVQDDPTSRLMGQFGGLAGLVGINLPTSNGVEPLAVLKSREFARDFLQRHDLLKVFFAKRWDPTRGSWKGPEEKWPDVRDGVTYFERNVRHVLQDRKTGLVTVTVDWKDAKLAAQMATWLGNEINERMRLRAIAQAEANVAFLRAEIRQTDIVALQQPVARLLELELQKLMLARSTPEYAFKIVDAAAAPKRPLKPHRKLVVVAAFFGGLMAAGAFVVAHHQLAAGRGRRRTVSGT